MSQFQRTGLSDDNKAVPIPSSILYAGITQQPGMARFPNQVSDAANVDFSTFDGATKRVGSELDRVLSLTAGDPYRLHAIDRDDNERYIALIGKNGANNAIRVFKRGSGTAGTVTLGTGVQTYLNAGGAGAEDIKLVTINDTTLVINTKVATGTLNFTNYTLTATWDDADAMTAQTPVVNTYHRAKADGVDFVKGYYQYVSDDGRTYPTYSAQLYAYTDWWKLNGDWDSSGSDPKSFRIAFRRLPLSLTGVTAANVSGDTWTLTKVGGFTGITFEAGEHIRITGGTGVTFGGGASTGFVTLVSRDSNDQITVVDATTGPTYRPGTSCALAATGDVVINGAGKEYEISVSFAALIGGYDSMSDIAARIQQEFRSLGENAVLVAWVPSLYTNGAFQITGPWKGNDAIIYPPLPPTAAGVAGSSGDLTVNTRPFSASSSDYTITAGGGGSGAVRVDVVDRWRRVPGPAEPRYTLDPATMPVAMVRINTSPLTFTIDQIDWDDRLAGDEETNDVPQPFKDGEFIGDAALYKNRLVFGMGRWVVASETSNLFNFYRVAEDQTVDSDRISIELSGDQLPTVYSLFAYREKLLVLTSPEQVYEVGGEAFTPSAATVTRGPRGSAVKCDPVAMDERVYYANNRLAGAAANVRQTAQVREYVYDDTFAQSYAEDITAHVPSLVESDIIRLIAIPSEGWLGVFVRDAYLCYAYRSGYQGTERIQSAWTKYIFNLNYRICDAVSLRNEVWMLVERVTRNPTTFAITATSGQYFLEVLRIEPDAVAQEFGSAAAALPVRLDRRVSLLGSFSAGTTTWTLGDQYGTTFTDATINSVILSTGAALAVTSGGGGATVSAAGNYSASALMLGRSYNLDITLSEPFVRYTGGLASLTSRPVIASMGIRTRRNGDFTVRRKYVNRELTQSFVDPSGYLATERTWRVYQIGPAGDCKVFLSSGSAYPVSIQAVEFTTMPSSIRGSATQ